MSRELIIELTCFELRFFSARNFAFFSREINVVYLDDVVDFSTKRTSYASLYEVHRLSQSFLEILFLLSAL